MDRAHKAQISIPGAIPRSGTMPASKRKRGSLARITCARRKETLGTQHTEKRAMPSAICSILGAFWRDEEHAPVHHTIGSEISLDPRRRKFAPTHEWL